MNPNEFSLCGKPVTVAGKQGYVSDLIALVQEPGCNPVVHAIVIFGDGTVCQCSLQSLEVLA